MNWLYYLLEANLYLAVFFAVYYLLLRRETFYQLNRAYLLLSTLIAFTLPLMQLGILKHATEITPNTTVQIAYAPANHAAVHTDLQQQPQAPVNYYLLGYSIIAALLFINLGYKIFKLLRLAHGRRQVEGRRYSLIEIDDDVPAFSFFNCLFINSKLTGSNTIIQHELVHIRQRHSWDIMYLELLKIACWFNPVVYLLQNSLKELHEYIADSQINYTKQDIDHYTDFLLSNAYGTYHTSLTNNFFHKNLLKKRIIMLHQKRSGYLARLKYLAFIPVVGGMLCTSTLAFAKSYAYVDLLPGRQTDDNKIPPPPPPQPQKQTKRMPPPPPPPSPVPVVTRSPYLGLIDFMVKNFRLPQDVDAAKLNNSAAIDFRLDNKGSINDIKIAQSAPGSIDEEVIRLMKAYKTAIPDKAGHHVIGVNFFTLGKGAPSTVNASIKNQTNFAGEFFMPLDARTHRFKNTPPPPPPVPPVNQKVSKVEPISIDTTSYQGLGSFYKYIAKSTRYPTKARDNGVGGKVFVTFAIDENKNLAGLKILRTPSKSLSEEVVRVLKNCTDFSGFTAGQTYTIPVNFNIQSTNGKWADIHADDTEQQGYINFGTVDTQQKMNALNEIVVVSYISK